MRMMMAKINDIILSGQKNPFVKEKKNEEHRQIQNQHDLNNLSSKKKKKIPFFLYHGHNAFVDFT